MIQTKVKFEEWFNKSQQWLSFKYIYIILLFVCRPTLQKPQCYQTSFHLLNKRTMKFKSFNFI